MTSELRIVIDSGVAISAVLLPQSTPRQAFDLAMLRGRLLISAETVGELDEVLRRAKFNRYVPETKRLEFLAALVREAEVVPITVSMAECRDPKDDKFLELAASGGATYIISSDSDLLVLHPCHGIAIVTPQEFIRIMQAGDA